jgi:predicted ATPase/DNA-binding XRE family transcriptional regulator
MGSNMPETISFGTWLRQHRRALDLTQKALANQVGCAEITVRRMEADEYKPSNELALVLFEKLGIPESKRPQWVRFARGVSEYPNLHASSSQSREQKTNLPIPLTSFIGREKEVERIQHRLAHHRLVTLIGAGGIGKTRLSQHVASQLLGEYVNGVWLVELASLSDPALVPQSVAVVFGIQQGTNSSALIETLIHFLRTRSILLILDNCEHLLDACAQLADKLLKNCPNLKILATSREALGIIAEALYQVPSLTIPEIHNIETIEKLDNYESVRLFDERAQLIQMDFSLTKENASSVAQICSRLDGIPLAIELAAVRVQMFSTEQIASQLNECFHTLTGGSRTALPRHQTLQASIDWSWHLLYDPEQIVLRRLSVFAGGFTLEAAGQVCAGNGIEARQIVGVIAQLVTKSLVVANQESGRERRYRLLETIREYAREKLVESGEEENIRTRHLNYYLRLSEQAEPALKGPEQLAWYERMTIERDNVRAALEWAGKTNVEAGLYISGRLWRYWEYVDLREGERWLRKFLQMPDSCNQPHARAQALYAYGIILYFTEQYALLEKTAEECLALFRAIGDQHGEIDALILLSRFRSATNKLGYMELLQQALILSESLGDVWRQAYAVGQLAWGVRDDYQQRISYIKEAVSLFRKAGDLGLLEDYLGVLGNFEVLHGDISSAQEHLDEAMQLSQNPHRKGDMTFLAPLGRVESIKGNFEKARTLIEKSIANASELGNRNNYLWYRAVLGHLTVHHGQIKKAREILFETAQEFFKDKNENGVVFALEGIAGLYTAVSKPESAAHLIGWADTTRERINDMRPVLEQADMDKIIAACIAKMGEVAFSDAYDAGQKMTMDEAVGLAVNED